MNTRLTVVCLIALGALLLVSSSLFPSHAGSMAQGRFTAIQLQSRRKNIGLIPAEVSRATFIGRMDQVRKIKLLISFDVRDEAKLTQLISDLYNPDSPRFHHWLTPEQFGRKFGRSDSEINSVKEWLISQGFNVDQVYSNRLAISFSGASAVVEDAFNVTMADYWDSVAGKPFYSNLQTPTLPNQIKSFTAGLVGLNNALVYHRPVHTVESAGSIDLGGKSSGQGSARTNASINGHNFMGPADLAKDYNYQPLQAAGFQGQGQRIGVIMDSDVNDSDMTAFRTQFGLPAANLQRVVLPNLSNPGLTQDGLLEANLDTQAVSGVAPLAEIDLITIPRLDSVNVPLAEQGVVNLGSIKVVSESFGGCEQDLYNTTDQNLFNQAAAEGIAFFASAGDTGAECVDHPGTAAIQCPACYSDVTSVGGTEIQALFDGSGNFSQKLSEDVWNDPPGVNVDCSGAAASGGASGGGISKLVAMPAYQQSAQGFTGGVPSGNGRVVPDIAALAGTPFTAVFVYGNPQLVGGTSLSSPLWAGMMGLINQYQGSPQGSPNTVLYQAGVNQYKNGGTQVFQDVTSGNNNTLSRGSCDPNGVTGFSAGTGYDPVSGWGVPNLAVLVQSFGAGSGGGCSFSISPSTRSLPASGGTGIINVTAGATCAWTASTLDSWITITGGATGVGAGTVNYSVGQNTNLGQRTGTILIGDKTFTITQAAGTGGGQLVELSVDSGSFQVAIGQTAGGTQYGVNRLTPASYPATLQQVKIYFSSTSGVNVGDNISVMFAGNESGSSTIDGLNFQSVSATVTALDSFSVYNVPLTTISSGDFVVGFKITTAANVYPFVEDQSPPLNGRSYVSVDGLTFAVVDSIQSNLAGNFGIRAEVTEGDGSGGGTGGGDSTPAVSNLSADLEGNLLTLSGVASDDGADVSDIEITLQDASNHTVYDTGQLSVSFGSATSSNFIRQINSMGSYPAAVSATVVLTDGQGFHSAPVSANFGNADAGGPAVTGFKLKSAAVLITGGPFSGNLQFEVNGVVVARSPAVKIKAAGSKLKVAGSAKALNLNSGPNRIRVIEGGLKSNIFVFVK